MIAKYLVSVDFNPGREMDPEEVWQYEEALRQLLAAKLSVWIPNISARRMRLDGVVQDECRYERQGTRAG